MKELNLNEIKKIQLNILDEVAKYCCENNIRYSLAYGTLIGAIRHKGYIPWDDDIDIAMPRPDYDNFVKNFNGNGIKIHTYELDSTFLYSFCKISDENTIFIENTNIITNLGVNIDLFPIDGIPEKGDFIIKKQLLYKNIMNIKIIKLNKKRNIFKNIILIIGKTLFFWLPMKTINNQMIKNAKKYSFDNQNFCCNISFGGTEDKILPKSYFSEYIDYEFENNKFKIIKSYHKWLKSIYGDYMQVPPIEQRVTHHDYKAYIKQ